MKRISISNDCLFSLVGGIIGYSGVREFPANSCFIHGFFYSLCREYRKRYNLFCGWKFRRARNGYYSPLLEGAIIQLWARGPIEMSRVNYAGHGGFFKVEKGWRDFLIKNAQQKLPEKEDLLKEAGSLFAAKAKEWEGGDS